MNGDEPQESIKPQASAFRWRVRPADADPPKMLGIAAVGILAFLAGQFLFGNPLMGLVGFAIIFGSTAEFWLGTSFSLDEKGATMKTGFNISAIEWADVKRVVRDSQGIKLSPLDKPGTMEAFRGVYLRYGKDNRDSIERAVLTFGQISDGDVVDRTHGRGD